MFTFCWVREIRQIRQIRHPLADLEQHARPFFHPSLHINGRYHLTPSYPIAIVFFSLYYRYRIVVIDPAKCKPNSAAFAYLKRNSKNCTKGCIVVEKKTITVSEMACAACITRCKQSPGDAISVVKLPANLETDTTHKYGPNRFKIHGLPTPRPGSVLGLLGTNGIGKVSC